jgi:hypothetical protein
MFSPSRQPRLRSSSSKASNAGGPISRENRESMPILTAFAGCARATSGRITAPPSKATTSRLLIR